MEKNSIGSFISALRKANGLTQKELAEKLNVSDKAVSRWERDESCPDLMLIPLIADIFGITADELLRGEKKKTDTAEKASPKNVEILLKRLVTKFNNQTTLSLGIAIAGIAIACAVSDVFIMWIPFIIAVLCFIASFVCQTVFKNSALLAISTDEFEGADLNSFRLHIKNRTWLIYGVIVSFAAACAAACTGFNFIWTFAAVVAAVFLILFVINSIVVLKSRKLSFSDKQKKNAKLKLKIISVSVLAVILTAVLLLTVNDYRTDIFADVRTFENEQALTEYLAPKIEEAKKEYPELSEISAEDIIEALKENAPGLGRIEYRDIIGGDIVFRNRVEEYPAKIYTENDYLKASEIFDKIIPVFIILFTAEAVLPFIIYFKKRKK